MNIVALYKTFSCADFIEASIESIYDYTSRIIFVDSNVNWLGECGENEVEPVARKWARENDRDKKIIHIQANVSNQYLQENVGFTWIRSCLKPDFVLHIDSDEIWDRENMQRLMGYAKKSVEFNTIHCNLHTYLKSPFYRVKPSEACKPCVLARPIHPQLRGIRNNGCGAGVLPKDLYYHHYSYCRKNEEDVFKKIQTTLAGDREDNPHCKLVDIEEWRKNKWDKLPHSTDLHTTKFWEKSWASVEVIGMSGVPETLRNKPIIQQYIKDAKND